MSNISWPKKSESNNTHNKEIDPAEIEEKFHELSTFIESAYEGKAELSKDEIAYANKNEYEIHMSFRVSGATSVSYWIKATHRGLTISCSYSW